MSETEPTEETEPTDGTFTSDVPRTRRGKPINQTVGRGPTWAGARSVALTFALGIAGASIALWLLGPVRVSVGPVELGLSIGPSNSGHTVLNLAPIGAFDLDTHWAPIRFEAEVADLDPDVVGAYITRGTAPKFDIGGTLPRTLALGTATFVGVAALGGGLLAGIARRSWRYGLAGAVVPFVAIGASLAMAAVTFNPATLAEPKVTGALALIPDAASSAETFLTDRDAFADNVASTTDGVSDIYVGMLGSGATEHPDTIRILHVSDLHLNSAALRFAGRLAKAFDVDVVANTGDDADWGSDVESEILGGPVGIDVPYLWVRGNHDTMTTQEANAKEGAVVLDGTETTVDGLTFFGVGDPTFSPKLDKSVIREGQTKFKKRWSKEQLLPIYSALPPADVVMAHDVGMTAAIKPKPRLTLAGHTHALKVSAGRNPDGSPWVVVINGSTGGAGLRVLDKGTETPMTAVIISVDKETREPLYLDEFSYRPLKDQSFTVKRIDLRTLEDEPGGG